MISGISGSMGFSQMAAMRGPMGNPFQKMDSNGDGLLDETELGAMAERISEKTGQSVDASQMLEKLDGDGDGLVNQEEMKAGRPDGPPPGMADMKGMKGMMGMSGMQGMMGGGMEGNTMQSFLDMLNSSADEAVSDSEDSLDANGDGVVDAEEAMSGMNRMIQEYQNQMAGMLSQTSGNAQLSLFA